MNPDLEQLTETFSAHESLAPDAESVLAKSHEIARTLKRRQWVVRATGGAMLGTALVAGGIGVPQLLSSSSHDTSVVSPASGNGGSTSAPAASPVPVSDPYSAFFDAGYTYDDAVRLASLWHENDGPNAIGNVKAEAGEKLIKGQPLPIPPSGTPASADDRAEQAFFNAGYDYQDAQKLAEAWHETDISQVKIEAGQKIENGEPLPVQPSGDRAKTNSAADSDAVAASYFFGAGYTYDDAVQLAQAWNTASVYQAKVEGGQKLEQGATLPIPPSGPADEAYRNEQALNAYFAAGYDYQDAVRLGQIWHESDTDQVKAEAGRKLEKGEQLPIAP